MVSTDCEILGGAIPALNLTDCCSHAAIACNEAQRVTHISDDTKQLAG
jgi:hypothetical protein